MGRTQSLKFWSIFGLNLPREKKNIAKNQTFRRNYILRTIRRHKFQVPDKSQNSYKIIKKNPFFEPKMGLNCPLGPAQGVNTNSHIVYNRNIHPYFMNLQVLRSGYLPFLTLPLGNPYFFLLRVPAGHNFGGFGAITPVNKVGFC